MSWTIKPSGSWGICTTTSPATETAVALSKPGSWLYDANPYGGTQRVFVRKDQWGTLTATPGVDNVSPSSGTSAGGTVVTITGEGLTGSTGVTFGGTAGTAFSVVSDSSILVTTPAHANDNPGAVVPYSANMSGS